MTVFTLAVGDKSWGDKAINLCLSIKANNEKIKVGLIYSDTAIEGNEEIVALAFNHLVRVENLDDAVSGAFNYKTQLFKLCEGYDKEILFLDADTIVLPSRDLEDIYLSLMKHEVSIYCNDVYNGITDSRSRKDYTFWFDVSVLKGEENLCPQYNTSFMFWRYTDLAAAFFSVARELYNGDNELEIGEKFYKGTRTDEYCFNLSAHYFGIAPSIYPYRPIFMSCFSEEQSLDYIRHQYPVMGFAGEAVYNADMLNWYNKLSGYYRSLFGLPDWVMPSNSLESGFAKYDTLIPHETVVLAKIGGFGNVSNGGIINPSAWKYGDNYKVLFRVDANLQGYKGKRDEAICRPYLATYDKAFNLIDVTAVNIYENGLHEDFRVVESNGDLDKHIGCSFWDGKKWQQKLMVFLEITKSIYGVKNYKSSGRDEKNWAWFQNRQYVRFVYSVEPFVIKNSNENIVCEHEFDAQWKDSGFISCSTYPVEYNGDFLMWVHKKQKNLSYLNSVMIFDGETLKPKYFIPMHVLGGAMKQPLYISSCLVEDDRILIFGGEGGVEDMSNAALSQSTVRIIDRKIFDNIIKQYPCR